MKKLITVLLGACLMLASSAMLAQVQIGATDQGCCSWSFSQSQMLGQQFTLNQATNITAISLPGVGVPNDNPNSGDSYTIEIVDALVGGNVLWSGTSSLNQPVFNPAGLTLNMGTYYLIGPTTGDHFNWNGSDGVTFGIGGSVGDNFWTSQNGGASWFANPGQTPLEFEIDGNDVNATPEPGSLLLMGSGLVGLAGALRRKFIA